MDSCGEDSDTDVLNNVSEADIASSSITNLSWLAIIQTLYSRLSSRTSPRQLHNYSTVLVPIENSS